MTARAAFQRVTDMVRDMVPHLRQPSATPEEVTLGILLRGNDALYDALTGIIHARIRVRSTVQEPSDPVACKSMIARDRELQWVLSRLEAAYRSPVSPPARDGELPAA